MTRQDHRTQAPVVKPRLVWDLPVRLFHIALITAFVGAFVTNRLGVSYFKYHVWCGYAVIVLVAFQIVWGLVGTRHAQFWNFVRGPVSTLRYLAATLRGNEPHFAGHNPLGAAMVVFLLTALGKQAVLGLFSNDEIFNVGPLYGAVSNELSLTLTSLHRRLFYWIAGAVGIHILAVLAHLVFKRENLVKAMITGRKPGHSVAASDAIPSSRLWLAALLVTAAACALFWVIGHAPVPVSTADY